MMHLKSQLISSASGLRLFTHGLKTLDVKLFRLASKKSYNYVEPSVIRERLLNRALSKNISRKAVSFSEDNSVALDLLAKTLEERYPNKNRCHLIDFSLLNGLLSRKLVREKWPRITACENMSIGNVLNLSDLKVPRGVDYQIVVDSLFNFQSDNAKFSELVFKGCNRSDPNIPRQLTDLYNPESHCYEIMCSNGGRQSKCHFVAVGCFGESKGHFRNLSHYAFQPLGHFYHSEHNLLEVLAFVPDKLLDLIFSDQLGKVHYKFLLDCFFTAEKIAELPTDGFEFYYKPTEFLPEKMSLVHIKPRTNFTSERFHGVEPEFMVGLYCFQNQWSFSPSRPLEKCLDFWLMSSLKRSLSAAQRKAVLKDCTIEEIAALYVELLKNQEFQIVLDSWVSQKFERSPQYLGAAPGRKSDHVAKEKQKHRAAGINLTDKFIEKINCSLPLFCNS